VDDVNIVVVGGCGHVGLPLSLALASRGKSVVAFDLNSDAVIQVNKGTMPFFEDGAEQILKEVLANKNFHASTNPAEIAQADVVVVVIGTPVDEHLNPDAEAVPRALTEIANHLKDNQLLILRSTVYPGVTRLTGKRLRELGKNIDLSFCPERIAEGKAFTELFELPQIISGLNDSAVERASAVFRVLTDEVIVTTPEEAELAKLFTNTWRYIKFAAANQFFMIANDFGVDFAEVRRAITHNYPRASDMPGPGFAAGPCLFKDTMQLAAFNNNNFAIGHASMAVNEGLPLYIVSRLEREYLLDDLTIGIVGMAFKAESDDIRSSLSYKLKRILKFKAKEVLCTDAYVTSDETLLDLDTVIQRSDLLIIGAPHAEYCRIKTNKPVIDIWNLLEKGLLT
jgi:UDP-N-acetyl-D-mannosaminuronic acid dehydrogenase